MVSLLPTLLTRLPDLARAVQRDLLIVSPYVGTDGTDLILQNLSVDFRTRGSLHFLTNLSPLNICQSSTDPSAILYLSRGFQASTVVHLPRVHAKVFVADNVAAIITSRTLHVAACLEITIMELRFPMLALWRDSSRLDRVFGTWS